MRYILSAALLALLAGATGCGTSGYSAGVAVSSAPPPPYIAYSTDPQFDYVSGLHVGVIRDDQFGDDMFVYGGRYYLYHGGYWYRSDSPRGTWMAVDYRRVPRPIFEISDDDYRWRQHPQGWRGRHHGRHHQRDRYGDRSDPDRDHDWDSSERR